MCMSSMGFSFWQERIEKHQIRPRDVPYEQRGGSYDNSDVNVGYVPSGFSTPHEWHDFQRKEKAEQQKKDFAAYGPTTFKSRSLQSFQEDLKAGKVTHLFPEMFAKQKLKRGMIKEEDVPVSGQDASYSIYLIQYSSCDKIDIHIHIHSDSAHVFFLLR